MYRSLLALITGITLPGFLPALLPMGAVMGVAVSLWVGWLVLHRRSRRKWLAVWALFALFAVGITWGSYTLHVLVDNQLPASLEGEDIALQGVITTPPQHFDGRVRLLLEPAPVVEARSPLPQKIQISWYRPPGWAYSLGAGDTVAFTVRLKRPRSFVNPSGFDYKLWQLRRGVGAVGYVRQDKNNRLVAQGQSRGAGAALVAWLEHENPVNHALISALLLGERSSLSEAQRRLLQVTGTSHLIAISGLHIGLAAALGYLLGLGLGKLLAAVIPLRAHLLGFACAAFCAWSYSALAGFSLPTQRALAMLLMLYVSRLSARHCGGGVILMVAALVVCTLDPLSLRDAGFWLSFLAVAALILVYDGALAPVSRWQGVWLPQLVVFIALLLPLGVFFGQVSLVSPLANVVAIPLISLLAVPLIFAAALVSWVNTSLAGGLLWLADRALDGLWWWLQWFARAQADYGWPVSVAWSPQPLTLGLVALSALGLLLPQALGLRSVSVACLLMALLLPRPQPPELAVTVMDVGQGLAVVVRAAEQTLVYDTGPHYSDSFDAGADIIAPWLQSQSVKRIDALVVSHAHADHAGGAAGLLSLLPSSRVYLGEPVSTIARDGWPQQRSCHTPDDTGARAQSWRWGELEVNQISLPGQRGSEGNSASCVVLLRYRNQTLLLPGDLEQPMEPALIENLAAIGVTHLDVLIAPHHGSKSSSSAEFVAALTPRAVVFSAGFNNRHGHPHEKVLQRYREVGSDIFNTAYDGAVSFTSDASGNLQAQRLRREQRRPWRDP
ncbi:DNA internalization-related competence protein ComEC/Rec2 [Gilvimarinus agarilyticus]|uniref:DNA internalization-related competence protein ComEC/Rec2 n=1 Tax=Gilvimarinus agarilyticus TaxID=679259 RepID=UPI0005A1A5E7|nr:DNA internalization-related competence protein ComEC/Rec2 [Gilvimarinus agarilyticus]